MEERDIAKKPVKDKNHPRFGMGYEYFDFICPTCNSFLAYEPSFDKIPKRCQSCGQLLMQLTREEAESI